jgi:hypothetical protein
MSEMHKFLTGFAEYNKEVPFYVEKPFTDAQRKQLRDVIETNRQRDPQYSLVPGDQKQYNGQHRFDPKKIVHMSRLLIEFDCPPEVEAVMDSYAKPVHKGEIALCHYNYIEYDMKYGEGQYAPALPPHLDADENLVTFNYMIGGNIDDWTLWIDDKEYDLKLDDAIVFSAVNQVHWRPKRKWKEGEFVEIVSFDYCPITNYRFTGEENPIDPFKYAEKRKAYTESLSERPEFKLAWDIYNRDGKEAGISFDKLGDFA